MSDIETTFQTLMDNAVKEGVAPGLQCVVFNRDEILFNGVSGFASLPSEENPAGKPVTKSTVQWIVSCTKIVVSLVALHVLEKGLIEGLSLADLDNPDALARIVPEFAPGSGSWLSKVVEGFEDHLGPDGKRILKLREPKTRVTLRHLFTHTSGIGTPGCDEFLFEMLVPSDGSVPLVGPGLEGPLRNYVLPLKFDPGTSYLYGFSTDWLAQCIIRGTGKNLRELFKEYIFDPLEIPFSEMDLWFSPEISRKMADYHIRDDDSPYKFKKFELPFKLYAPETLGEGMVYSAETGLYASAQAFVKVLQAVINKDSRILSPSTWELSFKDDFGPRGLKVSRPDVKGMLHLLQKDLDEFSKTNSENGAGMNLLQCKVALVPTLSGRSVGSFGWIGITNTFYFVDPNAGYGGILFAHMFPLGDEKVMEFRDQFEGLICRTLAN